MAFKPFKPPSLRAVPPARPDGYIEGDAERLPKRRKISESTEDHTTKRIVTGSTSIRKPLLPLKNSPSPEHCAKEKPDRDSATYFAILWRKFTTKKNKTWDDDGYLSINNGQAIIYSGKGKQIGQGSVPVLTEIGSAFSLAGREIEIGAELSQKDFEAATGARSSSQDYGPKMIPHKAIGTSSKDTELLTPKPRSLKEQMQSQITQERANKAIKNAPVLQSTQRVPFKQPLKNNTVLPQTPSETPIPRHDPYAQDALIFKRPRRAPSGHQVVDVVLDPLLCGRLRGHQREGIKFLYECVMNLRDFGGQGCILADDMGLGKTLQTIALIWTLIKQNPIYRAEPVIKKILIVCPVSLIQNWKKEFRKWLGRDRLGVLTLDEKGSRLSMFDGKNFKVLIVGYERLRTIAEDLTRGAGIDLVICDEGHRLKTLKNKSAKAIETLNTSKRVILSGTPIQNDLSEFFAMANFVNDGCLGSYKSFVKDFENPIMRSRQPGATAEDIERGIHASEELVQTTSPFILRRTADILAKYLPPKTEYVLFCNPTPQQTKVYQAVVNSPMFNSALGSHESALQLITILKKLCNSPALMRPDRGNDESTSSTSLTTLNEMLPAEISRLYHNSFSSKIRLLDELLHQIRSTTNDKVILVSNYTSTLNLMANLLDSSGGRYLRLDGSVPQSKRQGLVDEFNSSPSSAYFAFLLSAKAGGVGLNLVGANRLVLFDVDWNPATDDQAMARIHREGQKKSCKIYRFLIKGGLEERIWQRQVVKRGLANSIMDGGDGKSTGPDTSSKAKKGKAAFSREELLDLFRFDPNEALRTHELIQCPCRGTGHALSEVDTIPMHADADQAEIETDLASERSEELPPATEIIKASCLMNGLVEKHREVEDVEKHELMMYSHLNTLKVADMHQHDNFEELARIEAIVDDECLMQVLRQDPDTITGRIAYIFKKSSESEVKVMNKVEDTES